MTPETPRPWREDFPIDWQQDHYVARRDFVKFLVLTGAGFTAGQLCIGLDDLVRDRDPLPRLRLCGLEELKLGEARTFHYPREHDPCLLVRLAPDRWVAYNQKCTHLSCAVVPQPQRQRFYCPCHEGAFGLEDGRPLQGPPRRPLTRILLEVADAVYAVGVQERT